MRARHERRIAGGPLEGTATGVIGSLAYRFADTRTQPFVMGLVGLLRSRTTHTYPVSGGTITTFRTDDTRVAWGGGGGVRMFLTPRFSVRPQFHMVFSEATGVLGLAVASVALSYHCC